ncbi:MAG TPA: M48 family metalloprotease [Caulobacteraceae bacterium]|jgi:Zn-dependent protease with chaperone function
MAAPASTRRQLGLGALAAAAAAAAPAAVRAAGGPGGYSVSGKKGPFVRQVAGRPFTMASGDAGSMGLATDSISLGRYQTARLRMPQTEARVAALLARLDGQWPYAKGRPLQVHILGVDYYNAYSLPDGSIVVAFGLLDQAQSDDEVAFVLAHELGHVRLGHFAERVAPRPKPKLASALGQLYLVSAAVHAVGTSSTVLNAATEAGATNDLIHFLSNVMVEPDHTRAQEDEADCIGYDLSQAAAYSADSASARVFDTIQADQQKHQAVIDTLGSQLKSQLGHAISDGSAASFLTGGAANMRTSLLAGGTRLALGMAAAGSAREPPPQHRPPEERKRGMAQYSADAYPDGAPLRDEQHGWLAGVRATAEFAEAKAAVGAVSEAQKARAEGHYPEARAAIQRAMSTKFAGAPLVLNEAARLADDMGDRPGAEKLFHQANASPDQTVGGFIDYVRMLYRAQQNERAMSALEAGVNRFGGDEKPFISLRIAIARQAGHDDDVQASLQRCLGYDNEALAKDCRLAAGQTADAAPQSSPQPRLPSLPFGLPHFP